MLHCASNVTTVFSLAVPSSLGSLPAGFDPANAKNITPIFVSRKKLRASRRARLMGEDEGGGAAFSRLNNPDLLGARMGMALRNGARLHRDLRNCRLAFR
jgi:hypothetical protein